MFWYMPIIYLSGAMRLGEGGGGGAVILPTLFWYMPMIYMQILS